MKQLLGHDGPPQLQRTNLVTGEALAICPIRTLQRAERETPQLLREVETVRLEVFPLFRKHGTLPVAGGIYDQPARTMDELRLLLDLDVIAKARHDAIRPSGSAPDGDG